MVKSKLTCISLLFIGYGISYFYLDTKNNIEEIKNNELLINNYFKREEKKEEYIAILEIPKIKFKRGLYAIKDPKSKLNKNIVFLESSDMPDKKNSRVIIVGHSGSDTVSYFKNLFKLKIKNDIYLYYDNKKYHYKIIDKYEIIKTGSMAIEPNKDKEKLILVTCKDDKKQIVIISELIKKENLN